ncbi:hypothetical protein J2S25_002650 [Mesobacillus stamsii]|uniref:Uncharacterized protein n=1 Tax=Mesobacillus stamsii TaxID=225347 RepID=A0ABU0FWZ3_9BACI|nr:hypothetical protein [Mesobacillus stamsii]
MDRIGTPKHQILGNDVTNRAYWNTETPDTGKRSRQ